MRTGVIQHNKSFVLLCVFRIPLLPPHPPSTLSEAYRSAYGEPHHYYSNRNLLDPNMAYCKYPSPLFTAFLMNLLVVHSASSFIILMCFRWSFVCSRCRPSCVLLECTTGGSCPIPVWQPQPSQPAQWKQLP